MAQQQAAPGGDAATKAGSRAKAAPAAQPAPHRARTTPPPTKRRSRPATTRRRGAVAVVRLVEDDTEVLAAEHAACDAQLLDLLRRLSA